MQLNHGGSASVDLWLDEKEEEEEEAKQKEVVEEEGDAYWSLVAVTIFSRAAASC